MGVFCKYSIKLICWKVSRWTECLLFVWEWKVHREMEDGEETVGGLEPKLMSLPPLNTSVYFSENQIGFV